MNWKKIKDEYETTDNTLKTLAEKYDIKLGTLKSHKSRDAKDGNPWSRDGTKKDATKPQKVASKKKVVAQDEIFYLSESENDGFTDKQRLFIMYYVKYWNATKAYKKAYDCDYSTARTNGARLLAKANICDEIIKVRDSLSNDALLDKRTLLQKWIDIAFADVTDYLKFGRQEEIEYQEDGQPELDMNGNVKTYAFNYVHLNDSNDIDGALI